MATLRAIRKRIVSVRNTGQITRAMKMVAAAKLRRAQERIVAARPYADKMKEVIASLAARTDPEAHPLLKVREAKRADLIVITSDRGLCGAYNNNIIKLAETFLKARAPELEQLRLTVVGKKGRDYFARRHYKIRAEYLGTAARPDYSTAALIGREVVAAYLREELDQLFLVYSHFASLLHQRPQVVRVLPIEPLDKKPGIFLPEYIFEPSADKVLEMLLPRHVEVQLFRALLEGAASEHAARMTAMDSATKNTEDMVASLTRELNKARQAAITKEILDIMNGAEAQKSRAV